MFRRTSQSSHNMPPNLDMYGSSLERSPSPPHNLKNRRKVVLSWCMQSRGDISHILQCLGNARLFATFLFTTFVPLTPPSQPAKWWISSWISIKRTSNRIANTQPKLRPNPPKVANKQNYEQTGVSECHASACLVIIWWGTVLIPHRTNHPAILKGENVRQQNPHKNSFGANKDLEESVLLYDVLWFKLGGHFGPPPPNKKISPPHPPQNSPIR